MRLITALRELAQFALFRVRSLESGRMLILGYSSYILIGMLILALPLCRVHQAGNWLDWLFVSASAVSTTGLSTLSTGGDFTIWGQFTILVMIQLGGLGYMTTGSFVLLSVSGKIDPSRERTQRLVLNLPEKINLSSIVRLIMIYTFMVEAAGALLLWHFFQEAGVPNPLWSAIFHSISAFCTAGFSLYDDSLSAFAGNLPVNAIICLLSLLGAMGFLIVHDVWKSLTSLKVHVTLTTRVILASTFVLICASCLLVRIEEPLFFNGEGWLTAFFQVTSASTTVGFNTVPISQLSNASLLVLVILMLVGASPAGTGGGIKTTTVTALWAVMASVLRRSHTPTFAGRLIPEARRRIAVATAFFYILMLCAGLYLLCVFQTGSFTDILFECVSALGTVGLSTGLTGELNGMGKLIVTALMFMGRVGPLLLASSLFFTPASTPTSLKEEDVVV